MSRDRHRTALADPEADVALAALAWAGPAAWLLQRRHDDQTAHAALERARFAVAVTNDRAAVEGELASVQRARTAALAEGERGTMRLEALEAVGTALDCARLALDGRTDDALRRLWEVPQRVAIAWRVLACEAGAPSTSDNDQAALAAAQLLARQVQRAVKNLS